MASRTRLLMASAFVVAASVWFGVGCASRQQVELARLHPYEVARAKGRRCLHEKRWEEALDALGPWGQGEEVRRALGDWARTVAKGGSISQAVGLYRTYFRLAPFGLYDPGRTLVDESEAACEYAELLGRSAASGTGLGDSEAQAVAAMATYLKLNDARIASDGATVKSCAWTILDRWPASVFCPLAVLTHVQVSGWDRSCEEFLLRMKTAGAPARYRARVLLALAEREPSTEVSANPRQARIEVLAEARKLVEGEFEERMCLVRMADLAAQDNTPEGRLAARRLFRDYFVKYGDAYECAEAGRKWVAVWLRDGGPEQAMLLLAELEDLSRGACEMSAAKFDIAEEYIRMRKYDDALGLLRQIRDDRRGTDTGGLACLRMGDIHRELGDDARMVVAYEEAATAPEIYTGIVTRVPWSVQNDACLGLAEHHMAKRDWKRARTWWNRWEPVSGCAGGGCGSAGDVARLLNIAHCSLELNEPGEALPIVKQYAYAAPGSWSTVRSAALLARFYHRHGRLGDLKTEASGTDELPAIPKQHPVWQCIRLAEEGDTDTLDELLHAAPGCGIGGCGS